MVLQDNFDLEEGSEIPLEHIHEQEEKTPNDDRNSHNVTQNYHGVLQVVVPNEHRRFYEKVWLPKIFQTQASFEGFRSNRFVEVGSGNEDSTEYVVVLIFDTYDHFKAWEVSPERKELLQELSQKQIVCTLLNAYGGSLDAGRADASPTDALALITSQQISRQNGIKAVPRALPPPKWKLCLIITTAVYSILLLVAFAGTVPAMLATGMPLGLVLFISVGETVTLLSFAGLPLLMSIPCIDAWLRMKRRCEPSQMHPLHAVLDQGLQVFAVKLKPREVPREVLDKIFKLEGRVDKLLEMNTKLQGEVISLQQHVTTIASGTTAVTDDAPCKEEESEQFSTELIEAVQVHNVDKLAGIISSHHEAESRIKTDRLAPLTLACKHYVKWEHQIDFERWTQEMDAEMRKFRGFEGTVMIPPKSDGDPYINSFTFSTFEDLMAFSQSSGRKKLLCQLNHMLEATSEYQMAEERNFSDAFTELFVPTGGKAQIRPPPLWKSTILTIIPLHFVVWQAGYNVQPYIARHQNLHTFLVIFIITCFNVTINTYVALPLMLSMFGDWLNMPRAPSRPDKDRCCGRHLPHLSFKFFDEGLSFEWKIVFVMVFVGINIMLGYTL